jgi:hypothetical protein
MDHGRPNIAFDERPVNRDSQSELAQRPKCSVEDFCYPLLAGAGRGMKRRKEERKRRKRKERERKNRKGKERKRGENGLSNFLEIVIDNLYLLFLKKIIFTILLSSNKNRRG